MQTHVALSYPQTLVLSALAAGWLSPRKSSIDLQEAFPSFSDIIITKVSFIGAKLSLHACEDQTDEQILKILQSPQLLCFKCHEKSNMQLLKYKFHILAKKMLILHQLKIFSKYHVKRMEKRKLIVQ